MPKLQGPPNIIDFYSSVIHITYNMLNALSPPHHPATYDVFLGVPLTQTFTMPWQCKDFAA